ncbi:Homoserine kinase [Candidatus Methylomirabilis lanthanidiphila]|uniref:Homoserine kinase n=1 Tax=Candidatus Methylomirabilis lanthanidiphila TaxID=2211376 RepID=A0A564ZKD5_9BACT|nr:homoserine kinase [Candidatus Methylomirabilis lanthanidiphila]VUZ85785.1 Homoserine kinase [Candidatus Methylomirabilis lanthanidiphila]
MPRVRVRVPASTANLGPGFDTLGMALSLYNEVELSDEGDGLQLEVEGEGKAELELAGERNLSVRAVRETLRELGCQPSGLRVRQINRIPLGRGLGSSAAASLAGIAAAARLAGVELSTDELLARAVPFEGHPDNVTPALIGGLTTSAIVAGRVVAAKVPVPAYLKAVVVIPDLTLPTKRAREVLPKQVPFADAVFNLTRLALLLTGLATDRPDLLAPGTEDRLHQPYRATLVPGMEAILEEGRQAGALATCLSGAGSSLLALVNTDDERIGHRMSERWQREFGIANRALVLEIDRQGLVCLE